MQSNLCLLGHKFFWTRATSKTVYCKMLCNLTYWWLSCNIWLFNHFYILIISLIVFTGLTWRSVTRKLDVRCNDGRKKTECRTKISGKRWKTSEKFAFVFHRSFFITWWSFWIKILQSNCLLELMYWKKYTYLLVWSSLFKISLKVLP